MLTEARVLGAAWKSLGRKPLKPVDVKPGWRRFGAMETSSYGNLVTVLLLLLVVEAPGVHLILAAVLDDAVMREVVRGLLFGSSIYMAVWLIGDLRLLRETPGVSLGEDALMVEMGARVNGMVALANVTGAQCLVAQDANPAGAVRAIRITPWPPPNTRVRLSAPVSMRGSFGIPLRGELLDIYVDDPAGFVSAVEAAVAVSRA